MLCTGNTCVAKDKFPPTMFDSCRCELDKLRRDLAEQAAVDRTKALARLSSVKDDEIAATAIGWEKKITDLLEQVTRMGGWRKEGNIYLGFHIGAINCYLMQCLLLKRVTRL